VSRTENELCLAVQFHHLVYLPDLDRSGITDLFIREIGLISVEPSMVTLFLTAGLGEQAAAWPVEGVSRRFHPIYRLMNVH
jgi:hypothetical protein